MASYGECANLVLKSRVNSGFRAGFAYIWDRILRADSLSIYKVFSKDIAEWDIALCLVKGMEDGDSKGFLVRMKEAVVNMPYAVQSPMSEFRTRGCWTLTSAFTRTG
jgi:hypothetical protein